MRVVLYARVSTTDREQEPETQLLPLREFCQAQGWSVADEYVDHASATDLRGRVAWRRLLDDAAKRRVDIIVVWKMDRAFRSTREALNTVEDLRRWGVGLRSYTEPWLDTTSAAGEFIFTIFAGLAQFERSLIIERVKAGMARARAQGKTMGRPTVINGEWSTIEPLLVDGQISQVEAARRLGCSRASVQRRLGARKGRQSASRDAVTNRTVL